MEEKLTLSSKTEKRKMERRRRATQNVGRYFCGVTHPARVWRSIVCEACSGTCICINNVEMRRHEG
jgi:hypothetical protein